MKEKTCEFEHNLLQRSARAAEAGQDKELEAHLSQCANCREALQVAAWMRAFDATSRPKTLPKPGFIRWKARLIEKQTNAERATRPIAWAQTATVIFVITAVLWGLIKNQPKLAPTAKVLFDSLELVAAPLLIGFLCAVFICLTFAYKWREPSGRK